MKNLKLSVPSKTFLAGEYLALLGGPTLTIATAPRFSMTVSQNAISNTTNNGSFHPNSPAGRFLMANQERWKGMNFSFHDPLNGMGGFGASSAQFAMLHYFSQIEQAMHHQGERFFDIQVALADYQKNVDAGENGFRPSGADLIGQLKGGLTFFHRAEGKLQTYAWPFENLKVLLFKTPTKISTHVHLQEFKTTFTELIFSELSEIVKQAQKALEELNESQFLGSLAAFTRGLESLYLIHPETSNLLTKVRGIPGVHLARGCGALGADVIAVFVPNSEKVQQSVQDFAKQSKLQFIASEQEISTGFEANVMDSNNPGVSL